MNPVRLGYGPAWRPALATDYHVQVAVRQTAEAAAALLHYRFRRRIRSSSHLVDVKPLAAGRPEFSTWSMASDRGHNGRQVNFQPPHDPICMS